MRTETTAPGTNGRRREPTDLYATVLEVVKRYSGVARITRISYGAGMPVDRLRVLVDRLLALGLLSRREIEEHATYDITPRGQEFLDTYWKMRGFVEGFERVPDEPAGAPPSPRRGGRGADPPR
jgi:predicted transcriptional regulator